MSMYMNPAMAARLDPVLPEGGGLERMREVRKSWVGTLSDTKARAGETSFHPGEVGHLRKALELLGDDEEAKSTLMSVIAFTQMKNDVAGF